MKQVKNVPLAKLLAALDVQLQHCWPPHYTAKRLTVQTATCRWATKGALSGNELMEMGDVLGLTDADHPITLDSVLESYG